MGESYIVRKGGGGKLTASPTITIVTEAPDGVTFTLTNNDDNTAIISYEIDGNTGAVELATTATSSNITVALSAGTYTLSAYATVVGEVATQSTSAVEIVQIFEYELLYDSNVSATLPLTQIDITGLSISKDDELRMVYTFVSGVSCNYSIRANDITSNYTRQQIIGNGSSLDAARVSDSVIGFTTSTIKTPGFADIKVSNNDRFVVQSGNVYSAGSTSSGLIQANRNIVNTSTVTSITKLSIVASASNGIGTGSRIRLYKVNTGAA